MYPANRKRQTELPNRYGARYTSARQGFSKMPWSQEGVKMYNKLVERVRKRRSNQRTGAFLEMQVIGELENKKTNKKRKKTAPEIWEHVPVVSAEMQQMLDGMETEEED